MPAGVWSEAPHLRPLPPELAQRPRERLRIVAFAPQQRVAPGAAVLHLHHADEGLRALAQLDEGVPAGKIGRGLLLEGKGGGLLVRCAPHSRDAHRIARLRRAFMTGN